MLDRENSKSQYLVKLVVSIFLFDIYVQLHEFLKKQSYKLNNSDTEHLLKNENQLLT